MNEHPKFPHGLAPLQLLSGEARPLPSSEDAERHLLACCLIEGSDTLAHCLARKLGPEAFYSAPNATVFSVLAEIYRAHRPLSLEVLVIELQNREMLAAVGGLPHLMELTAGIPTTTHAHYFLEVVREKWLLRELARQGTIAADQAQATGAVAAELLEAHAAKIARMLDYARAGEATLAERSAQSLDRSLKKTEGLVDRSRWLYSGLRVFDERFGAIDVNEEDWFNLFAGVQSAGKSSLVRQIADHNLEQGKKGLVFLLETSLGKWVELAAAAAAHVNARSLASLPLDKKINFEKQLRKRHAWLGERLWICDDILPVESVIGRIEDHTRRHGAPDFVVVDHLHLLRSRNKFKAREPEMGYIAKELKKCFKRVHTAGLVPAQLNRDPKKDSNRRPACHDLRDSGEIEQAADRVDLLHTPDKDMRGSEQTKNQSRVMVEIIQDKSRNGPTGFREFWFDRSWTTFSDVHDSEFNTIAEVEANYGMPRKSDLRGNH